jgi:hypothetical protein
VQRPGDEDTGFGRDRQRAGADSICRHVEVETPVGARIAGLEDGVADFQRRRVLTQGIETDADALGPVQPAFDPVASSGINRRAGDAIVGVRSAPGLQRKLESVLDEQVAEAHVGQRRRGNPRDVGFALGGGLGIGRMPGNFAARFGHRRLEAVPAPAHAAVPTRVSPSLSVGTSKRFA